MLTLAALAALTAMAFVGASSAMAETTSLCGSDIAEGAAAKTPCVTHVHETTLSGAKAKLLAGLLTVACDVLFLGDALSAEGNPLVIHGNFTYTECGSCTVEELEGGKAKIEVLKEGHETAKVTGEGVVFVDCGGKSLECEYDGVGLLGTAKGPLLASETNGSVTITNQVVHKHPTGTGAFCPEESKLDIVTTPLSATYINGALLGYCVEYEHKEGGLYKDSECKEKVVNGPYELVFAQPGLKVGQVVCVVDHDGLWKKVGTTNCSEDIKTLTGGGQEKATITKVE